MEYEITKLYNGNLEFVYGGKSITLTNSNNKIIITDDEYMSIPENKKYLFTNGFLCVRQIEKEKVNKNNTKK